MSHSPGWTAVRGRWRRDPLVRIEVPRTAIVAIAAVGAAVSGFNRVGDAIRVAIDPTLELAQ